MNRLHILMTVMVVMVSMVGAFFAAHEAVAKVLTGTAADDTLVGTNREDRLTGLRGHDRLTGRDGKDRLKGSRGNDHLWGSQGNDKIVSGVGNDTMDGGANNDTYNFVDNFGADRINADSAGVDTLDFAALTWSFTGGDGVSIELRGQGSKLCPSTNNFCISVAGPFIENVVGTAFADNLDGNPSSNMINGGDGDDRIESGQGNDVIFAGKGVDVVFSGAGDDLIYARDPRHFDYIGCGPGFDKVETIHRDDITLRNCERAPGPRRGGI